MTSSKHYNKKQETSKTDDLSSMEADDAWLEDDEIEDDGLGDDVLDDIGTKDEKDLRDALNNSDAKDDIKMLAENAADSLENMKMIVEKITGSKVMHWLMLMRALMLIFGGLLFSYVSFKMMMGAERPIIKLFTIPFLVVGTAFVVWGLVEAFTEIISLRHGNIDEYEKKREKIKKVVGGVAFWAFMVFWLGFLVIMDLGAIFHWINGANYWMALVSVLLWALWIKIAYDWFKERKN